MSETTYDFDAGWLPIADAMADSRREHIATVNSALEQGNAVVIIYDHEHDSDATVLYYDSDEDHLLYSPVVDGTRHVWAVTRSAHLKRKETALIAVMADERRITPVSETPLTEGLNNDLRTPEWTIADE